MDTSGVGTTVIRKVGLAKAATIRWVLAFFDSLKLSLEALLGSALVILHKMAEAGISHPGRNNVSVITSRHAILGKVEGDAVDLLVRLKVKTTTPELGIFLVVQKSGFVADLFIEESPTVLLTFLRARAASLRDTSRKAFEEAARSSNTVAGGVTGTLGCLGSIGVLQTSVVGEKCNRIIR